MSHLHESEGCCCCARREFLQAMGAAGTLAMLGGEALALQPAGPAVARPKQTPTVRGAFLYPPTETLRKEGYWSWPGSDFDAEGRQRSYQGRIDQIFGSLGMKIVMDDTPLDQPADVERFIAGVKQSPPDGLLLIPFKKSHWAHVLRIVEEAKLPTVVLATLGVLLSTQIVQLHKRPGVYLISSTDDLDAVAWGMRMVRAIRRMKDSRLVCIRGSETKETVLPNWGTQLRVIPHARYLEICRGIETTGPVAQLAEAYRRGAKAIVQPTADDIVQSAKAYFTLRQIAAENQADALMMDCLPGVKVPHQHAPPCMGFMSLRDEGIPIGCQADLNPTLTLMLVQYLFDLPGFQQNAAMDTQQNLYFGSHCTSPSKMNGPQQPAEPYVLMNHAEAGWGCVPRVLFPKGQDLTMAMYLSGKKPQMLVYSGRVVECPEIPPTGGCRTNVKMTINEVADVCDVKGMHQVIFYGRHAAQLRQFCQLCGIEALS